MRFHPKFIMPVALLALCARTTLAQNQTGLNAGTFKLSYEKFTLANGLEVILHEDHSDPIVAVSTLVHVGSNREKPGKTGFAHFFEHMSFNHSENTPRGANRKLIPEWGGDRNGGTWNDGTVYYEVVPKDAFEKILWIDSDRLGFMINTVTKEALEKEIQVVKNEKRQNYDNVPYGSTTEVIVSNLYPKDHPYNWTVIGALPDLQAATLSDVKEFYEKYYGAANATLVIAGDIDIAKTRKRVEYWFGEIRKGPEVPKLKPQSANLKATKSLYYEDNFAKLPELSIVFPTVENYHPDSYALDVLAQILAGSRNSPLYKNIVEAKKLAPNVTTNQSSRELAGEFMIRVRANENTKLQDVKNAVDESLLDFEKNGFTDNELKRIKASLETDLYRSIGTLLNKAQRMARDNEYKGDPGFLVKATELTQAVTREDVIRVYNSYIKGKPFVMTSFVPKGQKQLAAEGSTQAQVWTEKIVQNVQDENVDQGLEAKFEKTKTKNDRSEPAFGEMPLFKSPGVWKLTTNNGLRTYGLETNELPLVSFELTIKGGHSAEAISKSGVANLLAQLLTQGTAKRTPAELEEAIDLLGANITVTSTFEDIRLQASCLEKNFEATFSLLNEILLEPRWDKAEFERLYRSVQTAIKGREANATTLAQINFYKLLYGDGHIFSVPGGGTKETLAAVKLEDLKDYYNKWFTPYNAVFHVAGAVPQARAAKAVSVLADKWKGKEVALPSHTISPKAVANTLYFIDMPGAKQSVLYAGKITLSAKDTASNNLIFANEILGVGSSGRLTQVLRIGKGYTYGAGSTIVKLREKAPFIVSTSVRANATLPSLEIIKNMLADYGNSFGEKETATTKNQILKKNTLAYESLNAKMGILREMSSFGKDPNFLEVEQDELVKMTTQDFKSIIEKYLKESEMIYLVVGDKATQWDEVKKLGKNVVELDIYGNVK